MVNMQAPKGTTQVSVEQQVFDVLENGTVQVPEPFVDALKDIGFRFVPARIVVSAEAAEAIAAAAKKLNLPVPQEIKVEPKTATQVQTPPAAAAKTDEPAPAAPGAKAPEPQAGATGNDSTMSEKQMTQQGW